MNNPAPQTSNKLNLLIVDDSEDDVYLLLHELKKGGLQFNYSHIETLSDLDKALDHHWDVLITDHHLLDFTSEDVLDLVNKRNQDLPIVIVSGEIGEDLAVSEMHRGAQDFVMKDNLSRLVPIVLREYRQYQSQQAHKKTEENYRFLRYHDNLTNLVNRKEFENTIAKALEEVKHSHDTHVLMFLDLDQFKVINDTCGHMAGDELLVRTTKVLKSCIREWDTLARMGGDEFGILLGKCHKEGALKVARIIQQKVQENRFVWENKPFEITISIGMVAVGEQSTTLQELLSCADIACSAAKDKGRNGVVWFSPDDVEYNKRKSEMQWAPRIRQAAEENKFVLFHQMMRNLNSKSGFFTEFLLRLEDNDELVPPNSFIPAAERYNLMPIIDRWVVKNVFEFLANSGLGHQTDSMFFINLSGSTLSDSSFFEFIEIQHHRNKINPNCICFEITETAAINNLVDAVEFISEIRKQGYKFALDDFGVGLSSFSYLKTIPIDFLKIDGSFVLNMLDNSIDRGIVEACNQIAHAAGLQTIAEFVECDSIIEELKKIGIDYAQGFGIKKPEPINKYKYKN